MYGEETIRIAKAASSLFQVRRRLKDRVLNESTDGATSPIEPKVWVKSEDLLAIILGVGVLLVTLAATALNQSKDYSESVSEVRELQQTAESQSPEDAEANEERVDDLIAGLYKNPFKPYISKLGGWDASPLEAFSSKGKSVLPGIIGVYLISLVLFSLATRLQGGSVGAFIIPFTIVFLLAMLAYVLAGQKVIKNYNLEYALWALLAGMIISNTIGTPAFMRPAIRTELYIKTGLVLLGAEVLMSRLLVLGVPGICISWIVTPIVLISTYIFGQRFLKIPSKSLNMVISADMSVCGVSAAIATAAACRAKKEELSLAIGISLSFTAVMMVVMPLVIRLIGLDPVVAGAWMGGTIDSTGAVAAAGGLLGPAALQVAVTIKMIQNILIGVVAFGVAVFWVTYVERNESGPRPGVMEIWYRFPKFVLGFIGASILFSALSSTGFEGEALVSATTGGASKVLRGWFFCLAFVAIGLETNFRELGHFLKDGKAVILYACGQTLNLTLTLIMAWLMFTVVFPQAAAMFN